VALASRQGPGGCTEERGFFKSSDASFWTGRGALIETHQGAFQGRMEFLTSLQIFGVSDTIAPDANTSG
jgi:hypothetical protein